MIVIKYRVFYHLRTDMNCEYNCLGVYETEQSARKAARKFLHKKNYELDETLDHLDIQKSEFNPNTFKITDTQIYECRFWNYKDWKLIPYEELEKP